MQELLRQYIQDLLDLIYKAWTAPPDQAAHLMGALVGEVLKWLIVYLVGRYLYEKIIKRK